MKLLFGNGKTVEVREVGAVIYKIDASPGQYLGLHGHHILGDNEAKELLETIKPRGRGYIPNGNS